MLYGQNFLCGSSFFMLFVSKFGLYLRSYDTLVITCFGPFSEDFVQTLALDKNVETFLGAF